MQLVEGQPLNSSLQAMTDGSRANRRGRMLEDAVRPFLDEKYQLVKSTEFTANLGGDTPVYSQQCRITEDIYGKKRRLDFILFHPVLWPNCLAIQCKWQASSGTVEEKFPFEVLSIAKNEFDTIIILDGKGYTAGAERWLKNQAGKNKLLTVMDLGEFARFHSQGKI